MCMLLAIDLDILFPFLTLELTERIYLLVELASIGVRYYMYESKMLEVVPIALRPFSDGKLGTNNDAFVGFGS